MAILNLTQHLATEEQKKQGLVDFPVDRRKEVLNALTFEDIPTHRELVQRSEDLVELVNYARLVFDCPADDPSQCCGPKIDAVMIGGAPYLMPVLQSLLQRDGYKVVYGFSRRESIEQVMDDGSVVKKSVYRHIGFVQAD